MTINQRRILNRAKREARQIKRTTNKSLAVRVMLASLLEFLRAPTRV